LLKEEKAAQIQQENMLAEAEARRMMVVGDLANAAGGMFEQIAEGTGGASDALRGFGNAAMGAANRAIQAAIATAAANQIKWASALGPVGIGVASAAIAGIFGLLKGSMAQSRSVKLAKGGLAYGETLATVGDNPGARFDPEVVAPLSKLEGMLQTTNDMSGMFRISGDDLVLVLENAERKRSRFKPK
jgi:hypothetical protein